MSKCPETHPSGATCVMSSRPHAMHTGTVPGTMPPGGVDWPSETFTPPKTFVTRGQRAQHMAYLRDSVKAAKSEPPQPQEWSSQALAAIREVCARGKDFTTAEDVWPLLDWPGDGRIMEKPVRAALKAGLIVKVGTRRLDGTYRSRDGHAFHQNKDAALYRPA